MNIDKVKDFLFLSTKQKELEESLERCKHDKAAVEKELLTEFEHDGVGSVKVNGTTVFLYRKLVARAKDNDRPRLIAALLQCGLRDYVNTEATFNTMKVEAYVRSQLDSEEPLPEPMKQALQIDELYFVRTRKG